MQTLSALACEAILAAGLVSEDRIGIQAVEYSDTDGLARIAVLEGTTDIEESQFKAIYQTTPLTILCVAPTRTEAVVLGHQAASAVYRHLNRLAVTKKGGILAVSRTGQSDEMKADSITNHHEAQRNFSVIHTINL